MNHLRRDNNYFKSHAADVKLEEISSSEEKKNILQMLCNDDLNNINIGGRSGFDYTTGDDLGWLGYFIGRSENLRQLSFFSGSEEDEDIHNICALSDGITRNRSIQQLFLHSFSEDAFPTIARESNGLRIIGSSVKELTIRCSIGSEGLSALAAGLANCTGLERLDLGCNNFSRAAAGLRSLSYWLQKSAFKLDELSLNYCFINDEGLQALTEGALDNCLKLSVQWSTNITVSGWRYLSASLQSESCCLENLDLCMTQIGDDGAEVLAHGLVGNKTLKVLRLYVQDDSDIFITAAGWSAFSKVLCDTSTINNTYLSNHTIIELWEGYREDLDEELGKDVAFYLQLNLKHPQYAARCKILMSHTHLEMTALLQLELKCLPLAVDWFERAKPCTALSIYEDDLSRRKQVLDEPEGVYQSRVLTALYEFVRGVPKKVLDRRDELALVAAYDDKIAMVEEENKRLRKDNKRLLENVEERDEKIAQKNKRLRSIFKSVRKSLDD
eukprot:scaffold39492_cov494-Skeletonema_dohrnii-CCMP3373.AAC.1